MNTIIMPENKGLPMLTVQSLCDDVSDTQTAFIGRCGWGPEHSLYLISYGRVLLASRPRSSWEGLADVTVDRFVDVEIKVL